MRIRPLMHITEDMKISILPTMSIELMQKNVLQLLRKLGTMEHNKFVDYIIPKKTCELGFLETVKLQSELFSSKTSLFHKRWKCLNLTKRDSDDYLGFASVISKNCDDFKLGKLSADNFKCLKKIKMDLKDSFPEVSSAGLGKCTKIKEKFELKENTRPIFRKKRNVPFAATKEINKELDRLVNMGIS